MSNQSLTSKAIALETQLASSVSGTSESLKRGVSRQLADQGATASHYDLYAVRRNDQVGSEIFGPYSLHANGYDEATLYGQHLTPAFRFRAAIGRLAEHAQRCMDMSDDTLRFAHRTALLWSDVGQLKDFLEITGEIDELVATLRTARFQFLRRDTPLEVVHALREVMEWMMQAVKIDLLLVDRVIDRLERAGIDPFAQDAEDRADG